MIAYFDTAGLVKLVIAEPGSDRARALWDEADVVVASLLVYVEARAALARAQREGRADAETGFAARSALDTVVSSVGLVPPSRGVVWAAGGIAERHGLRGYDAIHLASALAVGPDVTFVTADLRLGAAARNEGLALAVPA